MSDEETKPNERLESLLQRWGAREAARQADVSHLSAPVPRRGRRPSPALRWMPLAASVALCAVAAALFLAAENGKIPAIQAGLTGSDPADKKRIEKLAAEVAALRTKLGKTEERLARTEDELAKTKIAQLNTPARRTDNEIEALVKERVAGAVKQYEIKLVEQWRKSREQLAEAQRQLDEAHKGRDQARIGLAEAKHRFARDRAKSEHERDRLTGTLSTYRALHEIGGSAALSMLRSYYLSASAPGKEGAAACRNAARKNRLLERCAELRPRVRSAEARKLFDTIEALLTRLDLLDAGNEVAVARFRALLERAGLVDRIEKARSAAGEAPAVREWLLEAQLVLTEM